MIHGRTASGFERVRDAFAANFAEGLEIGAAFAAYRDGEMLVSDGTASKTTRQILDVENQARRAVATLQAPRGTHDVLPSDHVWWHVVRTMEEQTAQYGWKRIQTPAFEDTALFARTAGEASDVVNKEMYTFEDRSGRSLTRRRALAARRRSAGS